MPALIMELVWPMRINRWENGRKVIKIRLCKILTAWLERATAHFSEIKRGSYTLFIMPTTVQQKSIPEKHISIKLSLPSQVMPSIISLRYYRQELCPKHHFNYLRIQYKYKSTYLIFKHLIQHYDHSKNAFNSGFLYNTVDSLH